MSPFLKDIFYCLYLLGTLQHVWKLSVTSFCNMFLIKLNKKIPIIDIWVNDDKSVYNFQAKLKHD